MSPRKASIKEQVVKKPSFDIFLLIDIVLNLCVAFRFLQLWAMPEASDVDQIYFMSILIAFEFVMVHSGVFMAALPFKYSILIFFPIYGLFAWAFNSMVPDNSILYLYLVVIFNRMRFAFFNKSQEAWQQTALQSIYAVTVYFFLMMAVAFGNALVPRFGLTPEFLEASGYNPSVGGLFTEEPETALCLGFSYYVMLSLFCAGLLYKDLKLIFGKVPPAST